MEVSAEAKRIMVVALGKLYSSRSQRGGLRLHRSLLLTLVMKSARDIYHAAQAPPENTPADWERQEAEAERTAELRAPRVLPPQETPVRPDAQRRTGAEEEKENLRPPGPAQQGRKRRGKEADQPDFIPCKKAKLETGTSPQQPLVSSCVLVDYVKCSSDLAPSPTHIPIHIHRAIAAC